MKKFLRIIVFYVIYFAIMIGLTMLLYKLDIPYLSPESWLSPTIVTIIAVVLANTKKVQDFFNGKKDN